MGTVRIGGIVKSGPSTQFWLEADWVAQDYANNRSLLRVWLRAANGPSGTTASNFGGSGKQTAHADGYLAEHNGNPFLPSGYGQNAQRWHDSWDRWFGHDGNGYRGGVGLAMELQYGGINEIHYGSIEAPGRIPKTPQPPNSLSVSNILPTSFGVSYNRGDNMGAGIEQDQAHWYAGGPAGQGTFVWEDNGPSGYTNPAGVSGAPQLTPGTRHYVYIRSRNSQGWGGWAGPIDAETLAGGRAFDGSSFRNCKVRAWNGSGWQLHRVRQWNGSSWVNTR